MSDTNFNSILDQQADSIKPPPLLPQGTYAAVVTKMSEVKHTTGEKKTPFVELTFKLTSPIEVDDTDNVLSEIDLSAKESRLSFYITGDAASRFRDFMADHLHIHSSGRTMREMMGDVLGQSCAVVIAHAVAKNGNTYANIVSTKAA